MEQIKHGVIKLGGGRHLGVARAGAGDAEEEDGGEGEGERGGAGVAVPPVQPADGVPAAGLVPPHGDRPDRAGARRRRRLQVHHHRVRVVQPPPPHRLPRRRRRRRRRGAGSGARRASAAPSSTVRAPLPRRASRARASASYPPLCASGDDSVRLGLCAAHARGSLVATASRSPCPLPRARVPSHPAELGVVPRGNLSCRATDLPSTVLL